LTFFTKVPLSLNDTNFVGSRLQDKELFIDKVNVNFGRVRKNRINLSVYERGIPLPFACGSEACATFGAALKLGIIKSSCKVNFEH